MDDVFENFNLNSEVESSSECVNVNSFKETNIIFIETINDTIKYVEKILKSESIIAIDCEGIFLGKEGKLTLLQIAVLSGEVYVFDILKGGSLMFVGLDDENRGLKHLLENNKILKIIHDCRSDWESLLHQYDIRLHNFIDSQEMYFVYKLIFFQTVVKPISLNNFLLEIQGSGLAHKDKMKKKMYENPELWGERPIQKDELIYAAEDVAFLIKTWLKFKCIFNENLLEMVYFITILKVVNKELYNEFNEHLIATVLLFIKSNNSNNIIEKSDESILFDNDSNVKTDLMNFDYVDYFFQLKSITRIDYTKSNNKDLKSSDVLNLNSNNQDNDSSNIINLCLSYKNLQREYFNTLLKNK